MRTFLVAVLLLSLALAGCTGGDDDPEPTPSTSTTGTPPAGSSSGTRTTTSSSGTSSSSGGPTGIPNRAPSSGLAAVANGTQVTFNLTGSDPDGDTLDWEITFGDGNLSEGRGLPASVVHNYTKAGNVTAWLNVTDGKLTASANVTVVLAAGGGGPIQSVAGTWTVGAFGCGAEYDPFPTQLKQGSGTGFFAIDIAPATIGRPYTLVMTWDATPAGLGGDIAFYDAEGAYVDGNLISGTSPLTFTGEVPEGASFAITSVCDVPGAEIRYTA